MDESFIVLTTNKGFTVRRIDNRIIFRYRRLSERKYLYGDPIIVPVELLKKILENPKIIEAMLK